MCGLFSKPPAPEPVAPPPTAVEVDANVEKKGIEKARRRIGFSSTALASDRTALGAVDQASSAFKKTLG